MELNLAAVSQPVSSRKKAEIDETDNYLVRAAQADTREFLALYERYFTRVFGYVRVRIADPASCEDVTSQVFMTALAKLGSFRGHGPFAAWLFRIARNAVRDEQRRRRRPAAELSEAMLEEVPSTDGAPEEVAVQRERRKRLRVLLAGLPREHQHLLALRYGAELSFEELGSVLGVQPGTARVRVHRIVQELRRRYPDEQ
jgi:RNA polymerase sigma-70 factor (ECF subfamily)